MPNSDGDFTEMTAVLAPGDTQMTRSWADEFQMKRLSAESLAAKFKYKAGTGVETLLHSQAREFSSLRRPRSRLDSGCVADGLLPKR